MFISVVIVSTHCNSIILKMEKLEKEQMLKTQQHEKELELEQLQMAKELLDAQMEIKEAELEPQLETEREESDLESEIIPGLPRQSPQELTLSFMIISATPNTITSTIIT